MAGGRTRAAGVGEVRGALYGFRVPRSKFLWQGGIVVALVALVLAVGITVDAAERGTWNSELETRVAVTGLAADGRCEPQVTGDGSGVTPVGGGE